MRKILLIIFMFILVFIIYYLNLDKKIFVFSIGDYITIENNQNIYQDIDNYLGKNLEKNIVYGNDGDYRIIDLINDIKNNKSFNYKNKEYTINNSLIKADIILLSIGMNDLRFNKNNDNYDYVDEVIKDLDKLLKIIRKYCKEKIYIFNYYNLGSSELTSYVNNRLEKVVNRYNVNIIDISYINSNEFDRVDYDNISKKIKKYLNKFNN